MPEIDAYKTLHRTVKRGRWIRLENPITPGLPDCLVVIKDPSDEDNTRYTWLEAKELKFLRRDKVFRINNLRPEQLSEMTRLRLNGARVFILLHRPRCRWIIPSSIDNLLALQLGVDEEWLAAKNVPWQTALLPEAQGEFW